VSPAHSVNLLTVNAGSSSLRLSAYAASGARARALCSRHFSGSSAGDGALEAFLKEEALSDIEAVAHRVVHGGPRLAAPCRIDAAVEAEIRRLAPLAPLHNPAALKWIERCRLVLGAATPQVAVFDTGFYAGLPAVAATYALPQEIARRHDVRRYGFHGLAHEAMWRRWRSLRPRPGAAAAISLQLGAGCSITAVRDGAAVDTSMGYSPLEGLVMATRAGDVDPGLLLYLQRAERLSPDEMERVLNERSGLLGLSGTTGDMRRLGADPSRAARLAVDVYCYRARKYVGAYLAALGGADAILFGGGVGEHAPAVRRGILAGLQRLGIELDEEANRAAAGREGRISAPGSAIEAWVVPVDEAALLAEKAVMLLDVENVKGNAR
jgi:acetate kinase